MVAMPKLKSRKHRVDRDHISILTDEDWETAIVSL
jgi:hypothetical protein